MRVRAGWTIAALLLAACDRTAPARVEAPADTTAGEVPFSWAGTGEAAMIVPVHVNGTGPHEFVLDTGATLTCVSESLAAELSLPEPAGTIGFGAGAGGAGRMRLVEIDSIRVGGALAEDLPGCALDLRSMRAVGVEIDGLLGLNFLRPFRLVIDFERQVVLLEEPE